MRNILTALLLTFCLSVNAQDVSKEPPITVYFIGNVKCVECRNFHTFVSKFYDETEWAKKATLTPILVDSRAPNRVPTWYWQALIDERTWSPTALPKFVIWAKTNEYPEGREIASFNGFRDPASWYKSLKVLLDAVQPHMKDGIYQEDGFTK